MHSPRVEQGTKGWLLGQNLTPGGAGLCSSGGTHMQNKSQVSGLTLCKGNAACCRAQGPSQRVELLHQLLRICQ